jgi:SAM-dependent methyltransferase
MLDHARSRAAAVENVGAPIDFQQADAMTYPFEPVADLLISRFGVMFFADQLAAFSNLRRALKPGARFAFICWRERASVEWMQWPLDAIAKLLPPPEDTTGEPGPFGLADAEATVAILTKAGFSGVTATPVDAPVMIGAGEDPVADAMTLLLETGPVARLLKEAEPATRAETADLLRQALEGKVGDGGIVLGAACWLYRGQI